MISIEQIWIERSTVNSEGKRVPTFWNPIPLVANDGDTFDGELMARITALGLTLELPVGELVTAQMRRIPGLNTGLIEKVLKAAISDEARHDKGMRYASAFLAEQNIPVDTTQPQQFLSQIQQLPYHPITLAALLEVTVFLPMLGFMRLYGGQAFNRLALRINDDEQRHTRVNSSLAAAMGESLPTCSLWKPIRDSLIDYLVGDRPDKDLFVKASNELWQSGDSPTLNSIPRISALQFMAPFTVSNSEKYARTVSDLT